MSFCSQLCRIVRKLKPLRKFVRNYPVNSNWCLLLQSQMLCKTPCAIVLFLKICVKTLCATVALLEMGDISYKAKTCPKHRPQPCCCSKLFPSQTAQLSFSLKLARIVRKLKPVRNCMRNCPVNQNWCLLLKS